jgi:urease accessory protein
MLQGDSAELGITVQQGARLGVVTQGANRIYTPRNVNGKDCTSTLKATVEKDGFLVLAPDPCVMFASSKFSQLQRFDIHPESSVALIDWFSSGRFMNEEQWQFDKLYTRTSLHWLNEDEKVDSSNRSIPFLQDSTLMDMRVGRNDTSNQVRHAVAGFNCFASLILYGTQTQSILKQCHTLSSEFAAKQTRIRDWEHGDEMNESAIQRTKHVEKLGLAGRVIMGVSQVQFLDKPSDAHVIRLAGRTNEDLYRVLHECLLPVSENFGLRFYKERICAHRSEIANDKALKGVGKQTFATADNKKAIIRETPFFPSAWNNPTSSNSALWPIVMLADSGLPTGSFAHSAGLETAAQLGMIHTEQDVEDFVNAATQSAMQVSASFLIAGYNIATREDSDIPEAWQRLHDQCQAVLATNEPACSASLDQGKSLARVATQWVQHPTSISKSMRDQPKVNAILQCLRKTSPHLAPTLGVICRLLDLEESQMLQLFAYCVARDLISAAVRLSLVGPLASVPMLHQVHTSASGGLEAILLQMQDHPDDPLMAASASAPVIEALHPCHNILQVRLFRS